MAISKDAGRSNADWQSADEGVTSIPQRFTSASAISLYLRERPSLIRGRFHAGSCGRRVVVAWWAAAVEYVRARHVDTRCRCPRPSHVTITPRPRRLACSYSRGANTPSVSSCPYLGVRDGRDREPKYSRFRQRVRPPRGKALASSCDERSHWSVAAAGRG